MTTGEASVRLSVDGAEEVRSGLEKLGKDGQAALDRLNAAGKPASNGLSAVSAVISDLKGQATGFAVSLGPLGSGMIALGQSGLVAAAAIGAVVAAFGHFKDGATAAFKYAQEVKDGAEQAGLSIPIYQTVIDQVQKHGVEAEKAATGLNKFASESAAARDASGELYSKLKEIDPTMARAFATASDQGQRLVIVMQALARLGNDAAGRAALSTAAFGRGGAGLGNALSDIGDLDALAAKLQKIGVIIDTDIIKKQAELGVQTAQLTKQISRNWDEAYANVWEWSKDTFAAFFGFSSALSFSQWIKSFTSSLRADAPEPGSEGIGGSASPTKITINPAADSAFVRRQQQISALKDTIATERERLGLLGDLATKDEKLKLAENEVTLALLQRKPISKDDAADIKEAASIRVEAADIAKRATLGVATEEERRAIFVRELNQLITDGVVPEQKRQQAMALYDKTLKETVENEKVRASTTPQLTRLAFDADNLQKQLDTGLAQGLQGTTQDLLAMAHGTETVSQGLTNMANRMGDAIAQALLMKTVIGPVANLLSGGLTSLFGGGQLFSGDGSQSSMGGGFGGGVFKAANGGTFAGGSWGVVGERGPELINAHPGGGVSIFPNHFLRGLPGFSLGGFLAPTAEIGPEAILPLPRGGAR